MLRGSGKPDSQLGLKRKASKLSLRRHSTISHTQYAVASASLQPPAACAPPPPVVVAPTDFPPMPMGDTTMVEWERATHMAAGANGASNLTRHPIAGGAAVAGAPPAESGGVARSAIQSSGGDMERIDSSSDAAASSSSSGLNAADRAFDDDARAPRLTDLTAREHRPPSVSGCCQRGVAAAEPAPAAGAVAATNCCSSGSGDAAVVAPRRHATALAYEASSDDLHHRISLLTTKSNCHTRSRPRGGRR
jgi:hypothetical protein